MARPSNTDQRRREIVEGLLTVMGRKGYEGASIQEIGKAAGLAPGLVHYHFKTKQEVLLALVHTLAEQLERRYQLRAGVVHDPHGRLYAFIDAHVSLNRDANPKAVAAWNVIGAEAIRQTEVRTVYRRTLARSLSEMRSLVRACLRAEQRSTREAGRIAAGLISAIEGAYRIAAAAPEGLPRGYAAPMVRRMAETLIAAQPRST
jgi:TetR/AcrR family transcriptional repressor of bet genes